MKFGEALELCRQGKRIHRTSWNGKNQFVYYKKGCLMAVPCLRCSAVTDWAEMNCITQIEVMGHFDIKTTAGVIQYGWLASQGDMQGEDWEVLE
jgi:hypothetical protein